MRRMLFAGMLALPFLLTASAASAQAPGCNTPGGCGNAAAGANFGYGFGAGTGTGSYRGPFHGLGLGVPPHGAFSIGFRILPLIHQHGPLVNYGPFEGYYPFEPYGPWTSDLKYTGSLQAPPGHFALHQAGFGGGAPTGRLRLNEITGGAGGGFGGGVRHSPCGSCSSGHSWGSYSMATQKNVGHRVHGHHRGGCSDCHSAIQSAEPIQAASLSVTER